MEKKINFLIHPCYNYYHHHEASPHEETAKNKWYNEIEKMAQESNKFLVILSMSTDEDRGQKKGVDQGVIGFAQEKLGDRCIVLPYDLDIDIAQYADKLKEELKRRNIINDYNDLRFFSSSAFGEYAQRCVVVIADKLNKSLGLDKKTQVVTHKSLSAEGVNCGPDSQKVNTAVRGVINREKLKHVVVKDRKIKKK